MESLTAGDQSAQWELLTVANQQQLTPRELPSMAPIDEHRILIIGGEDKSDGFIFDTQSKSVQQAFDERGFEIRSWSNQTANSKPGQVTALVLD